MGVLACDRRGCQNIMCDRYSHKFGYICNECFDELEKRVISSDFSIEVELFMDTDKETAIPYINRFKTYINDEFKER